MISLTGRCTKDWKKTMFISLGRRSSFTYWCSGAKSGFGCSVGGYTVCTFHASNKWQFYFCLFHPKKNSKIKIAFILPHIKSLFVFFFLFLFGVALRLQAFVPLLTYVFVIDVENAWMIYFFICPFVVAGITLSTFQVFSIRPRMDDYSFEPGSWKSGFVHSSALLNLIVHSSSAELFRPFIDAECRYDMSFWSVYGFHLIDIG